MLFECVAMYLQNERKVNKTMYDAKKGYGLNFTKFDDQYEDCIIYRESKRAIIELADKIIRSFGYDGLMSQLNEMQGYALYNDKMSGKFTEEELKKSFWADKFEIPGYFVNLLLQKYNMCVLGW